MTLYMNNAGSRWIDTAKNAMQFVLVLPNGTRKVRKADWFESFGNFACIAYRYQGKRLRGMPKSESGCETRLDGESMVPYIFLDSTQK